MIEKRIRNLIGDERNWNGSTERPTNDLPLITNGILDSPGTFNVVSFVEGGFDVEILDEELVPDNFDSLRGIARLVESKRV